MAKKKNITKENVISFYMDYFLEHNKKPNTVYQFAKLNNFEESEFYKHFTNFETIDETIFEVFFDQTLQLLQKSDDYENYDAKTKLLSFYYTFFELLTANRSFVVAILNHDKNQFVPLVHQSISLLIYNRSGYQTVVLHYADSKK